MALPLVDHKPEHFTQQVERAVLDLRCAVPVAIRDGDALVLALAIEGIAGDEFGELKHGAPGGLHLVLNDHRLQHMGVAAPAAVARLGLAAKDGLADAIRWAVDPAAKWPLGRTAEAASDAERAALALLRRGLMLPAAITAAPGPALRHLIDARIARREILEVTADAVFAHCEATPSLWRVSEASVPLAEHVASRFVVFRELHALREHVAVLIGDPDAWHDPVPVRVHSACLTGDLFGSMRCDCGSQLRTSVAEIAARGGGVLLYLAQEGRGIGLANKMRTYQIQDDGADTVDANEILGFAADERHYAVAREMLAELGVTHVDLMTNNPAKLEGLNQAPVTVAHRSHLYGQVTAENRRYLVCKAERTGHWLDDLLHATHGDAAKPSGDAA